MMKRLFDVVAATAGLVISSPVLAVAAVAIKIDSEGPVLFSQERVGKDFHRFRIYKLRSMTTRQATTDPQITSGGDRRVTRVGRILRKTKIDELPQLFNVVRGEMSLVGPRPEVPKYVEMFRGDYAEILRVRPGITDNASVAYYDEEAVLAAASDPERAYIEEVLPRKIALAKEYVRRPSIVTDLRIIVRTISRIVLRN